MNFEVNKIAGAVLGTALGIMVVGIVADMIYAPPHHEQPGYVIAVAEPGGEGTEEPAAPAVAPIADRLQTASVEDGESDVAKCKTCHTFEKGGPNRVGPTLWGVVGANFVHVADFDYSDAMRAKGEEGMTWTFENLDHFIENPKGFIPGTAMTYAGVKNPAERADIIAYLRTLSDSPVPLPAPTPAPTAEAPPAAGEVPPATEPPAATETPPAAETPPATTETPPAAAPPPATAPPAAEPPAPAPGATEPPANEPSAVEPPATEAPAAAEPPAAEPPADAAPAPAPTETPAAAPAESGGASSGESGGAAPAPAQPEPPAEAMSPEGAPEPGSPPAEAPAQ